MVTLVSDPFVTTEKDCGDKCSHGSADIPANKPVNGPTTKSGPQRGYDGYVEPDTKIPPKARPVMANVSVNGISIEESRILAEAQQHPAKNPGEALMAAACALVVQELLLQEARSKKIAPEPVRDADGGVETKEDALIRQLMEQEIDAPVSDKAVRQRYYDLNKHRFKSEDIYEARHILIPLRNDDEREGQKALTQSLIEALGKQPGSFKKLAKEYSECPSKLEGGNLGQLTTGSTVPEFEAVLEKMETGQIWPEPVETRFGFHVIHLVNKVPGDVLPFKYVEERIGAWLEASAWSKAVSQYISILAGKAKITGIDLKASSSPLVQ